MSHLDDLPQRGPTHNTEAKAELAFLELIEGSGLFVVQSRDRKDYGTDIQLELRDGSSMTNIRVHVQLKGTEQSSNRDESVDIRVERTNLNYLLAQRNAVYVCFHIPSERLLVRYVEDVFREYEHARRNWHGQDTITVRFSANFDTRFQTQLHKRALYSSKYLRDRRLSSLALTPGEVVYTLPHQTKSIEIPTDPALALTLLTELYNGGYDQLISDYFVQFQSILDEEKGQLDLAYLSEINLGITQNKCDEDRVRSGILRLELALQSGKIVPGTLLYCIGNGYLALQEYDMAVSCYVKSLADQDVLQNPSFAAQCQKNYGSALMQLGKTDEARNKYEAAIGLDPLLAEAHLALAIWYLENGDRPGGLDSALDHLDKIIKRRGSGLSMSTVLGWRIQVLFEIGRINEAFRDVFTLLAQTEAEPWILSWCAHHVSVYGQTSIESTQLSVQFWSSFLGYAPLDLHARYESQLCALRLRFLGQDSQQSFTQFRNQLTELMESGIFDNSYLWDRIGHWAQLDGNWIEAAHAYKIAYEEEPARYGYCYGTALNFLGQYDAALPILIEQANKIMPDAMSWFQVAKAYEGLNQFDECIGAYEKAISLDDSYAKAWFNLGGVHWNAQRFEDAISIWSTCLEKFPEHELTSDVLDILNSHTDAQSSGNDQ